MTSFLALYRGDSVVASKLIALSTEPSLVADFASRMLQQSGEPAEPDDVLQELERGRQRALQVVKDGAQGE